MSERLAMHGGAPVRSEPFGPGHAFGDDDIAALTEVVRSGHVGKGPKVDAFERAFAARHGVKHAIAVTSGTAAMHVCIGAINPEPGDEVIVTPWTAGGTIMGALLQNCVPVFADIDETYTLDPADVEAKITPRTRAIIAVHYLGNPCDMRALRAIARRHDLALIEDCAQAHFAEHQGQVVGSIGDIAGYSFGGKHLSAGTGGAVLTNDTALWERAVLFHDVALPRAGGPYADRPYGHYFMAPHYIINDLTAAVLLVQLQKVDGYIASKIRSGGANHGRPGRHRRADPAGGTSGRPAYLLDPGVQPGHGTAGLLGGRVCRRGAPRGRAADQGREQRGCAASIDRTAAHGRGRAAVQRSVPGRTRLLRPTVASPSTMGGSGQWQYGPGACPNGEALMGRTVGFNMWPHLSDADIDDIVGALRKVALYYRGRSSAPA